MKIELGVSYIGTFNPARNEYLEARARKHKGTELTAGYCFAGRGTRDYFFLFKTPKQASAFKRGLPRWASVFTVTE